MPRENGVRHWAQGGLAIGLVYVFFLSRLGLTFPCFASGLFTVGRGIFLCAAHRWRFFGSLFSGIGLLL